MKLPFSVSSDYRQFTLMNKVNLITVILLLVLAGPGWAQLTTETTDQREFILNDEEDERYDKIEPADKIFEMLKQRAEDNLREKRMRRLLQFRVDAGVSAGYETNPTQASDDAQGDPTRDAGDGDFFIEERLDLRWQPEFHSRLKAEAGYRVYNVNYTEEERIDLTSHKWEASLKFYPFKRFRIEPGIAYTYNDYPNADRSTNAKWSPYIGFRHYIGRDWNYGAEYEYTDKDYDDRLARDGAGLDMPGRDREDIRHTYSAYVTRYFDEWRVRLRYRYYDNDSNDLFLDTYDFDSNRYYLTLSKTFLDKKLLLSVTPSYETRDYKDRLSGTETREDDIWHLRVYVDYRLDDHISFNYGLTWRDNESNSSSGNFDNLTNSIGVRYRF